MICTYEFKEGVVVIKQIIKEVESSIRNENFIAALSLALTLPDICGKAEYPNDTVGKRYIKWFNEHLGKYEIPPSTNHSDTGTSIYDDMPYMSGEIVYLLRNSVLHQGTPNIDKDSIRESRCQVNHFVLTIANAVYGGSSCIERSYYSDEKYRVLEINLVNLCSKLCLVAKAYYEENKSKFDFFEYDLQDMRIEGTDLLWGLNFLE